MTREDKFSERAEKERIIAAPFLRPTTMDTLQIPEPSSIPGPSRHSPAAARPTSLSPTSPLLPSPQQPTRKRASHSVTSSSHPEDQQQPYRDIYSHPAAIQYAANHPRRAIPKFGPYLLLHTLGEGEFGKVKLGLHTNWGEEVAVKLIKRHNVESAVRMSKVEREIEVLRVRDPFLFVPWSLQRLTDHRNIDAQAPQYSQIIRRY
jgi:protein-serine/threonine kinase